MDCKNPMLAVFDDSTGKYRFIGAVNHLKTYNNDSLLHDSTGKVKYLPCGQCLACRINRSKDWAARCVLESRMHDQNSFITLTYNPENLPKDLSLHKDDFQKFMKRLRKFLDKRGIKISYYMCGEYGELYQRPHYHVCIFGWYPDDYKLWRIRDGVKLYISPTLQKLWPFGFITVGDVTYESAAYVARYVVKKYTGEMGEEFYGDRLPPYTNMSLKPAIGQRFFEKFSEEIYQRESVIIKGNMKAKIPRYYDNIYDRYYGEGAFDLLVKQKRELSSDCRFKKLPVEYTLRRVVDRAKVCEVKAERLRRDYVEE